LPATVAEILAGTHFAEQLQVWSDTHTYAVEEKQRLLHIALACIFRAACHGFG
jgi:hypothetical protein